MKRILKTSNSIIYESILKYDYSNFELSILEYCNREVLLKREQYYMDLLKPEYNMLKFAGSKYGVKLSEKTKLLIGLASKGRRHTEEAKKIMSELAKLRKKEKTSFFGKNHSMETILRISKAKSLNICIKNIHTKEIKIFLGNKEAANFLRIGESTLGKYKRLKKVIQNKYVVYNK
jgi:group I intron endonuclease